MHSCHSVEPYLHLHLSSDDFGGRPGVLVAAVGGPPHRRLTRPPRVQLLRQPGKCSSTVLPVLQRCFRPYSDAHEENLNT